MFLRSFAFLLVWLGLPIATLAVGNIVDLGYAKYKGIPYGDGVKAWLGLRFAAPPIGALRFAAPVDPPTVGDVQHADKPGPRCLPTGSPYSSSATDYTSEDCLFANVYAPANASNLPVYIFIQGGGFNENANANINGSGFIQASGFGVVVVNFNYRVGPYGFLASKEVVKSGSTNNGLKDQRQLFKWVQQHIAQFGGDPNHVVIGGASAGGASVTLHLTAYNGRNDNLFVGAAAESQSFGQTLTVAEAQYIYDAYTVRTNCNTAADTFTCLRNLSNVTLQDNNINIPFTGAPNPPLYLYQPVIDNDIVTDYAYALYARGAVIPVPAIYGDVTNEGTIFVPKSTSSFSDSDLFLTDQFPALTSTDLAWVHEHYPETTTTYPNSGAFWRQCSNAYGELRYICPGVNISTAHAISNAIKNKGAKIWNYHWNVKDPDEEANGRGVTHTVELSAIWGSRAADGKPIPNGGPKSYKTSNRDIIPVVQGYWTSFVKTLDPNAARAPGTPAWVDWGVAGQRMKFETGDTGMEEVEKGQRERCDYWGANAIRLKQ